MRLTLASALLGLVVSAAPAGATSITFSDDLNLPGFSITLTNQGLVSGSTYDILLTVGLTTDYENQGTVTLPDILTSIAFDLSDGSVSTVLGAYSAGAGTAWTAGSNNLQNSGNGSCNSPEPGATCLQETFDGTIGTGNLVLSASNQQFTWQLQTTLTGSFSDVTSIKVFISDLASRERCRGNPETCTTEWSTSKAVVYEDLENSSLAPPDTGTPVPEPGALLLLGTGLVALSARLRRRQQ